MGAHNDATFLRKQTKGLENECQKFKEIFFSKLKAIKKNI